MVMLWSLHLGAEETGAAVREDGPATAPAEEPPKKEKRARKAAVEDPSMMLEPLPEEPKKVSTAEATADGAKKSIVVRTIASPTPTTPPPTGPGNLGSSLGAPGPSLPNLKPTMRLGRVAGDLPSSPEIAVILSGNQFFPSRIRLKDGVQTRLYFTTVNDKPAALIIDRLQIQRWIAKEGAQPKAAPTDENKSRWETTREVTKSKVTEILLDARRGTYSFFDALTGAKGQLIVE